MIQLNSSKSAAELHLAISQFTQELFGNPVNITAESDPEPEIDDYFAVRVATCLEVPEIVRLNDVWHHKLLETAGESSIQYRLALEIS